MQRLEVSGAVRLIYVSLGVKRLTGWSFCHLFTDRNDMHFFDVRDTVRR